MEFKVQRQTGLTKIILCIFSFKIEDELKKQLEERIPDRYYSETGIAKAMDKVQDYFDCCGINSISDWSKAVGTNQDVPASCCKDGESGCTKRTWTSYNTSPSGTRAQYNQGVSNILNILLIIKFIKNVRII